MQQHLPFINILVARILLFQPFFSWHVFQRLDYPRLTLDNVHLKKQSSELEQIFQMASDQTMSQVWFPKQKYEALKPESLPFPFPWP